MNKPCSRRNELNLTTIVTVSIPDPLCDCSQIYVVVFTKRGFLFLMSFFNQFCL